MYVFFMKSKKKKRKYRSKQQIHFLIQLEKQESFMLQKKTEEGTNSSQSVCGAGLLPVCCSGDQKQSNSQRLLQRRSNTWAGSLHVSVDSAAEQVQQVQALQSINVSQ